MQKQKNKNRVKGRELNRRGAEKEGTDMDAFVNSIQVSAPAGKVEMKQDDALQKYGDDENAAESTKNIKDKDNYESKREKNRSELHSQTIEKNHFSLANECEEFSPTAKEVCQKNKHNKQVIFEEVVASTAVSGDVEPITIYKNKIERELPPNIVTQKNAENCKEISLCDAPKEDTVCTDVLSLITTATMKTISSLKYVYADDQWSPINTNGKKVYGREFLMKLQNDPNSKIKPLNLPDLDVVLKDTTTNRSAIDLRFKDTNLGRHDSLFPGFVKSSLSTKVVSLNYQFFDIIFYINNGNH